MERVVNMGWIFLFIIIIFGLWIVGIIQKNGLSSNRPNAVNSDKKFEYHEIRFGAKKDILKFDGNFVAIDCETTGLTTKDEIIEISAVKYENFVKIDSYSTLINPKCFIPPNASKVNGINNSMVKECLTIREILPRFLDFIGDKLIVCHNAPFDMKFILRDCFNTGNTFNNSVACTLRISRKELPNLQNYKLQTIAKHFHIDSAKYHRATEDAEVTAQIFIRLLESKKQNLLQKKEVAVSKDV
jgi:DNA polymerase-3 subunit alpha (Gram-positive type)